MNESTQPRILVLEDCQDDAALLAIELSTAGSDAELRCVSTAAQFRDALSDFAPDLVVSDANLPGYSGLEAFAWVREASPDTRFVFLTGDEHKPAAMQAADAVLDKDRMRAAAVEIVKLLQE